MCESALILILVRWLSQWLPQLRVMSWWQLPLLSGRRNQQHSWNMEGWWLGSILQGSCWAGV